MTEPANPGMPMIEWVAIAMSEDGEPDDFWKMKAGFAIDAMREPTAAMLTAAVNKAKEIGAGDFVGIWRAMVEAALREEG